MFDALGTKVRVFSRLLMLKIISPSKLLLKIYAIKKCVLNSKLEALQFQGSKQEHCYRTRLQC